MDYDRILLGDNLNPEEERLNKAARSLAVALNPLRKKAAEIGVVIKNIGLLECCRESYGFKTTDPIPDRLMGIDIK